MRKIYLLAAVIGFFALFGIVLAAPQANIFRNIYPETNNTYDLGSSTTTWRTLYVGNCVGCGGSSGNSAFTIGSGKIYNATSTDSVLVGTSTPTTSQFFVQGQGTNNPLTVASSTGLSYLQVKSGGQVNIANGVLGGASATDNFLSVTGTLASTTAATSNGVNFVVTSAGAGTFAQRGLSVSLNAGYTGSGTTQGLQVTNSAAGTNNNAWIGAANIGGFYNSLGTTAGHNVGIVGSGNSSQNLNVGAVGRAISSSNSPLLNIGVGGEGFAATTNIGGYFALFNGNTPPTFSTSSALVADNVASGNDIFEARNNGSIVFDVTGNGNVGIGSTTPAATLGVGGNLFVTNSGGTQNYSVFGTWNSGLPPNANDNLVGTVVGTGATNNRGITGESYFSSTTDTSVNNEGVEGVVETDPTSTANLTAAVGTSHGGGFLGAYFNTFHQGSGTITSSAGVAARGSGGTATAGNITNAADFLALAPGIGASTTIANNSGLHVFGASGTATVTNNYGVLIDSLIQGTNRWGIYQNGSTDNNYFAGNVGLGTTTPSVALGLSPTLRQTVKTLLTVRCKFIVPDPGTDLGWACR